MANQLLIRYIILCYQGNTHYSSCLESEIIAKVTYLIAIHVLMNMIRQSYVWQLAIYSILVI